MDDRHFLDRYGPWAVVAGAGAGLGAEYVRQLAARDAGKRDTNGKIRGQSRAAPAGTTRTRP